VPIRGFNLELVSAKQSLDELSKNAPFPIRMIQADNGTEFTNALLVIKAALMGSLRWAQQE